ncbi:uncharacterized protein TM35_000112730 [Trypanosoma theileri]|uniref:Homologous recombination OB-fold protein OB-fold domain-containing protein n=1 Tax=Trypanosoma theileri TaxID=67003 RepID=A0A1X0NZV4_9TRYP|nr:uncharacterized protein TM35_000112730 [Trypanosoma theileri]ORC89739.1 hypothetical protein TM35_000112730 [Trypanosoma theileri]
MDVRALLQREASARGLSLTSLSEVSTLASSQKVACCGGLVEKIVAESAEDCTVLLRDTTGTMHCAIHGAVTSSYPDAVAAGALLLFRDITVVVVPALMPPILIVCLEHLIALLLPGGPPESGRALDLGEASSSFFYTDMTTHSGDNLPDTRKSLTCDIVDDSVNERYPGAATATNNDATTAGAHPETIIGSRDDYDDDDDCLELADDL